MAPDLSAAFTSAPCVEQQLRHREIVLDDRVGERLGPPSACRARTFGAVLDEKGGDLEAAAPGGVVQRRGAHGVALVDVGAVRDLLPHRVEIAGLHGLVQVGAARERKARQQPAPAPVYQPTYWTSSSISIPNRARTRDFNSWITATRSAAVPPPAL